jgi:hypothetical protein
MNKLALATVFVLSQAVALSAFAQEKTRAEVKAEAASAVKSGAIPKGEQSAPEMKAKSTKARADVKSDTKGAVKAGETAKSEGEKSEGGAMKKTQSTKARADVKAETKAAVKAGEIPKGEAEAVKK